MGDPDDDDDEMSLLDNWQRFEDGTPTLRMTNAQVSEAWRSAARKSTHRVILRGPASVGNDPGPAIPVETWPAFPVDADACSPGECDLEPPPGGTRAFAPVLEHDDVPLAEFKGRFTRTVTLEAHRGTNDRGTTLVDFLAFGGWLDYTQFNVSLTRWCTVGAPGCSGTDPVYAGGGVSGFMAGSCSGTTPTGVGSATWGRASWSGWKIRPRLCYGASGQMCFLATRGSRSPILRLPMSTYPSPISTTSPREPGIVT